MSRTPIVVLIVASALAAAGTAQAGCWATVGLSPLPRGVEQGERWNVDVRVMQHGRTPMADAAPTVIVANEATGARLAVPAALADPAAGRYRAEVVFPAAGTWTIAVDDGFPEQACAQTHTFGTATIASAAPPAEPPASPASAPASAPAAAPSPVATPEAALDDDDGSVRIVPIALGAIFGAVAIVLGALALRSRRLRVSRPPRHPAET